MITYQHRNAILSFLLGAFLPLFSWSQCNGSQYLCSKRYHEVAYLTTHNAFNAEQEGFLLPNQNVGVTQQLNDGVRGFMIDVYDLGGVPTVYHGQSFLGTASLLSVLMEIRDFMDNHPAEVVTIILECYVSSTVIESELIDAGLYTYLYSKPASGPWSTLEEMINSNKRLVIFTDVDDALPGQEWYHYAWDHCVETHYSVNNINAFTNDYNRGNASNDLFIFNHFVTSALTGTGLPNLASSVNDLGFLLPRIQDHFAQYSKFPNFVTLDFYDIGSGLEVVDTLNSPTYVLQLTHKEKAVIYDVYPNPAVSFVIIFSNQAASGKEVSLLDEQGRCIKMIRLEGENTLVSLDDLEAGTYFISGKNTSTRRFSKLQ